jgi:hypothetical protein
MPFEILHIPFMLFRRLSAGKCAEIPAMAGFGIQFAGIETIFAANQFANHNDSLHETYRLAAQFVPSISDH